MPDDGEQFSAEQVVDDVLTKETPSVEHLPLRTSQDIQLCVDQLYDAFYKGVEAPEDCFKQFRLVRQEYNDLIDFMKAEVTPSQQFFFTLRYEYDPTVEVFRFMGRVSRMHATLRAESVNYIVHRVEAKRYEKIDNAFPYRQHVGHLIRLTESAVTTRREVNVEGHKILDMMIISRDFNIGLPLCIGEIVYNERRDHAGNKLDEIITDYNGKIIFGFVLKVEYQTPPKDGDLTGMNMVPDVHFDIYRAAFVNEDGQRKFRVERVLNTLRLDGVVQEGFIEFFLHDFYPRTDWGVGGIPPDQFIRISYEDFIDNVILVAAETHWESVREEHERRIAAEVAHRTSIPEEPEIVNPKRLRELDAEEEAMGVKRARKE